MSVTNTTHRRTCRKDHLSDKLEYFAEGLCHYDSCAYIAIPPRLKSLLIHHTDKLLKVPTYRYSRNHPTPTCIHLHNSLEHIDLSFMDINQIQIYSPSYSISGLDKLKYLNLQGCQIPFSSFPILSPITELHIGGNIIAPDNILRTYLLQTYTNLILLKPI